jgi:hypothetical protein
MTSETAGAADVVRRYAHELYTLRNTDIISELVSDPTIRHEPGGETNVLTHADSVARAHHLQEQFSAMRFDHVVFFASDEDVCWVFDAVLTRADGTEVTMCGAEIFRVRDGKIVEVWNPAPTMGHWG